MKQLGEWWINFLDQREIFSMSSSPLGRESSTRWKGWKEKWLHIHHSFFSTQALQHKLLLWSFHQTFGISNGYYPNHKNMAMYSVVAFSRIRDEYSAVPQVCFLHSLPAVSGTQWKQSHRPDASNVFPQWNTQLSLWRSAIKIPDFWPRTCHHVYR